MPCVPLERGFAISIVEVTDQMSRWDIGFKYAAFSWHQYCCEIQRIGIFRWIEFAIPRFSFQRNAWLAAKVIVEEIRSVGTIGRCDLHEAFLWNAGCLFEDWDTEEISSWGIIDSIPIFPS